MRTLVLLAVIPLTAFSGSWVLYQHGLFYAKIDFWLIVFAIALNTLAVEWLCKGPKNTKS
jgi:hypothetical protein